MRSLLRAKARAAMRKKGLRRVNKHRYVLQAGQVMRVPSFFADHWREFV